MLGMGVGNSLFGDVNGSVVTSPTAGLATGRPARPASQLILEPAVAG
jgi:hypothetical protein